MLAILAVLILLLMTDLSPRQAFTFEELPSDGKTVQVPCIAMGAREANGGVILELQDKEGSVMEAYCSEERMVNMTMPCAVLVTGSLDDGPEPFMFVETIVLQN